MFARPSYWWAAGGALAVIVTSLGIGTTWSYLKTAWRSVGQTIRDATPLTFELERLDTMLSEIQPQLRQSVQVVAQLEVEVEDLQKEIAKLKEEQQELFAQMTKLREHLATNNSEFQFAGQKYTRAEVERDLNRRLDIYEERQAVLAAKEQLLEQKKKHLEAAKAKVAEYRRTYDQLVVKSESLRAQLKSLESEAALGKIDLDNNKLSQARQLAQEIERKVRVYQRTLESERFPPGEIPVDVTSKSAVERFDELLRSQNVKAPSGPET